MLSEARAQGILAIDSVQKDAGRIEQKVDSVVVDLREHKGDEAQENRRVLALLAEMAARQEEQRKDTRALYRTVRTGNKAARLEDAGP